MDFVIQAIASFLGALVAVGATMMIVDKRVEKSKKGEK